MSNYIATVKKKMSKYAKKRADNLLTGNYGSVVKGRSMEFDDIRVYQYGDDVKDMDWKASARSRTPMVRRYEAIRKHNVMIVADAGRSMAALAPSGESKRDVATFAAAVISYIAEKNNDPVGITFGNDSGKTRFPLKENIAHIEYILDKYEKSVSLESGLTDMNALLGYVTKCYRERMFLFIITDVHGAMQISEDILRRLRVRHEQMIVMVDDMSFTAPKLTKKDAWDVTSGNILPHYIRKSRRLRRAEEKMHEENLNKVTKELKRLGIKNCHLDGTKKAIPELFKMMEASRHVR